MQTCRGIYVCIHTDDLKRRTKKERSYVADVKVEVLSKTGSSTVCVDVLTPAVQELEEAEKVKSGAEI